MKIISAAVTASFVALLACDEPQQQPQDPSRVSYDNGYPQTQAQANGRQTTYQNGYAQQGPMQPQQQPITYTPTTPAGGGGGATIQSVPAATATVALPPQQQQPVAVEMQTTPVPLGVQPLPLPAQTATAAPPAATIAAPPTAAGKSSMAVPGPGAFQCTSDAQCLLGRCNTQYSRCAYPCKSSENDCKAGNVCTAGGICMPKGAAGIKM
jgi:hypothetical protein